LKLSDQGGFVGRYSAARDLDLAARIRWYVLANRTEAVIYVDGDDRKFHFLERMSNPSGQLAERELTSDRPGRSYSSAAGGTVHHSLDRHRAQKHEEAARRFARSISQTLETARNEGRFGSLVLVAEPHFLGLLRDALPSSVQRTVRHEVNHEYGNASEDELRVQVLHAIGEEEKEGVTT
jgi:protein required for attachment to host cells